MLLEHSLTLDFRRGRDENVLAFASGSWVVTLGIAENNCAEHL